MKKRILRILTAAIVITVFLSLSIVTAFAGSVFITLELSLDNGRRMIYTGDEVKFNIEVENLSETIDSIHVFHMDGGSAIAEHGIVNIITTVDIPVKSRV